MTQEPPDKTLRARADAEILRSKDKEKSPVVPWVGPELEALIQTGTGYYRPPEGITANLERLTLEQMRQWHKTWHGPNNATLIVVGDIAPDEIKSLAEEY